VAKEALLLRRRLANFLVPLSVQNLKGISRILFGVSLPGRIRLMAPFQATLVELRPPPPASIYSDTVTRRTESSNPIPPAMTPFPFFQFGDWVETFVEGRGVLRPGQSVEMASEHVGSLWQIRGPLIGSGPKQRPP
jgi:hypothetical protein